jgi:hypothetical protein
VGKQQPAPPPEQQSAISIPPPPAPSLTIRRTPTGETVGDNANAPDSGPKNTDPDIQKILDQISERQSKTADEIKNLSTEKMAFGMMREIPRDKWNTPLTEQGHWPRGSSIAEIKKNPELMKFTPAQAMLKLFEMSDAQKGKSK